MHPQSMFIPHPTRSSRSLAMLLSVAIGIVMSGVFTESAQAQTTAAPTSGFGGMMQKLNPMNWKMPKPSFRLPNFLVRTDDQNRIVERKDTLLTDVQTTASKSWQRTKESFSPSLLNPRNLFAGPNAGKPATPPSTNGTPGFFGGMIGGPAKEPDARVADVTEFLGQQRPK
ncbi:MAG: hypothetical protein AAGJ40_20765 [Planctomycetota bacterium]